MASRTVKLTLPEDIADRLDAVANAGPVKPARTAIIMAALVAGLPTLEASESTLAPDAAA